MDKIIKSARDHYERTKRPETAGHIWHKKSGNIKDLTKFIEVAETAQDIEDMVNATDMYAITIRGKKRFQLMMDWYKDQWGESKYVTTPNLYKMFFYCKRIGELLRPIETILELGGGNGQFAYMAKNIFGFKTHIDIDLPESLYMAYVCTAKRFPDAKLLWVHPDTKGFNFHTYDFIFIPVGLEGILKKREFDLFINTASMGEMSNDNIEYWMDFIQTKVTIKNLFTFNRFLNTIPKDPKDNWHRLRKNENKASLLYDNKWDIQRWEVEPFYSRCPYDDPRIARYVEILATRLDKPIQPKQHYLLNTKQEDWYFYKESDGMGTMRSNQLSVDLTITGTLFRLWNAIRLGFNEAPEMMLAYLETLRRNDVLFEEELYYKELIK